jgi:hypothetical protein
LAPKKTLRTLTGASDPSRAIGVRAAVTCLWESPLRLRARGQAATRIAQCSVSLAGWEFVCMFVCLCGTVGARVDAQLQHCDGRGGNRVDLSRRPRRLFL